MAVVTLPPFYLPIKPAGIAAAPNFTTSAATIDAADEGIGFILSAPKSGNIKKVWWRTSTVTNGATIEVRIETVTQTSTPAFPSGTLWGTTTNGTTVVANADDNTGFLTTLTSAAAVTAGDLIAVHIKNPNTSFGNLQISLTPDNVDYELPYAVGNTGVSPAVNWNVVAGSPVVALEYDDGSYAPVLGVFPWGTTITTHTFNTGSTPDAIGLRFQTPAGLRIRGFWAYIDSDGDYSVKLVSTAYHQVNATGILASVNLDKDATGTAAAAIHVHDFTAKYSTTANTNYRLIIEPTSATNLSIYDCDVNSLAMLDGWCSQLFHLTTAKDPTQDSDWTNYNSGTFRMPLLGLVVDGVDTGSGGGGLLVHPGLVGGMRG